MKARAYSLLERQHHGRRYEKMLPKIDEAQLSLFDEEPGEAVLEEETSGMKSLSEEICRKAEERRPMSRGKAISQRRSYKLPSHLERREVREVLPI